MGGAHAHRRGRGAPHGRAAELAALLPAARRRPRAGVFHFGTLQLLNYQRFNWDVAYNPWTVNNRRTRGGPLSLNPPGYQVDLSWQSDSRKILVLGLSSGTYQAESDRNWYLMPSVQLRPVPSVSLSVEPMFSRELSPVQYIDAVP